MTDSVNWTWRAAVKCQYYCRAVLNSFSVYRSPAARWTFSKPCMHPWSEIWLLIITVWTVVQTVLTATFNSYGDRQISTHQKINTPEPIDKKFGTINYGREGTFYTKFGRNPSAGGFWANGWNITKIIFIYLYLFFLWSAYRSDRGWIFTRDSSKDVKSPKDVPFGGLNNIPSNLGSKTPKKLKFWGRE